MLDIQKNVSINLVTPGRKSESFNVRCKRFEAYLLLEKKKESKKIHLGTW